MGECLLYKAKPIATIYRYNVRKKYHYEKLYVDQTHVRKCTIESFESVSTQFYLAFNYCILLKGPKWSFSAHR